MAEKKLSLDLEIKKGQAEKSAKSIKQELREAREEAFKLARKFGELSPEAVNAAKKLAVLRDEMDDLNQAVQGLNPDKFQRIATLTNGVVRGFQAAQGAAVLFGKSGEDIEKTIAKLNATMAFADGIQGVLDARKQFSALATQIKGNVVKAFSTLKGAIVATGIGALVVLLGLLIQNFDKVKTYVLNLFPGLGKLTDYIGGLVDKFTDFIGVTTEAGRALEKSIEKQTNALEKLEGWLDRNLDKFNKHTAAKLQADADYRKKKLELDKKFQEDQDKAAYDQALKELQDQRTRFINRADQERKLEAQAAADKIREANKTAAEKAEADRQARLKERLDEFNHLLEMGKEKAQKGIDAANVSIEVKKNETEGLNEFNKKQLEDLKARNAEIAKETADHNKYLAELEKAHQDQITSLKMQGATAAFDLLFALNQQRDGATESQQKKEFERNKGLQIAETLISTYFAAQQAYASQMTIPTPDAPVRATIAAALAVTQGLARVISIRKTQFNSSGSSASSSGGGSGGVQAAATGFSAIAKPSAPSNPNQTPVKSEPVKVFVVQKDLNKSKKIDDQIKIKATVK